MNRQDQISFQTRIIPDDCKVQSESEAVFRVFQRLDVPCRGFKNHGLGVQSHVASIHAAVFRQASGSGDNPGRIHLGWAYDNILSQSLCSQS